MDLNAKLRKLIEDNNYNIMQHNGQRIYSLTTMAHNKPPRGCEVFVGRLPSDAMEDELVPLFAQIAPLYELRLMVNFNGESRGYCFVRYFSRRAAETAICRLNNYNLRPGVSIGVYWSVDNTRLFIGGLPMNIGEDEILLVLESYMDGIKKIILYPSHDRRYINRGYAFLEFENHRAAAIARRKIPIGAVLWDAPIKLDWADPIPEPDPEIMSNVATLYMRNIPMRLTSMEFQEHLNKLIIPRNVSRVHKIYDYAFVHFANRATADVSMNLLRGFTIWNQLIEVSWARPQMYSRKHTKNTTPDHYCLSLPARSRWLIKKKCAKKNTSQPTFSDNDSLDNNKKDKESLLWLHHKQLIEQQCNDFLSLPSSSSVNSGFDLFDN